MTNPSASSPPVEVQRYCMKAENSVWQGYWRGAREATIKSNETPAVGLQNMFGHVTLLLTRIKCQLFSVPLYLIHSRTRFWSCREPRVGTPACYPHVISDFRFCKSDNMFARGVNGMVRMYLAFFPHLLLHTFLFLFGCKTTALSV